MIGVRVALPSKPKNNLTLTPIISRTDSNNILLRKHTVTFSEVGSRVKNRKVIYESDGVTPKTDWLDITTYGKTNRMDTANPTDCKANPTATECQ